MSTHICVISQHGHPLPVQRLSKSITAACVTLAAIKRFKQQFLTFMNKWPWMDDSGSIQFPSKKVSAKTQPLSCRWITANKSRELLALNTWWFFLLPSALLW